MKNNILKKALSVTTAVFFLGCVALADNPTAANTTTTASTNNINTVSATNPGSPSAAEQISGPTAQGPLPQSPVIIPSAPELAAQSYVLMDYNTGQILAQENMNDRRAPASLTKLMTLYLVFNAIKSKQISLNDNVPISPNAWKTGGSRMFVVAGTYVPLKDLIKGVIVDSGNDATVALAEYVAGSTDSFVPLMNQQAQALGMKDTHYSDVDGLPQPDHFSTAYDLALLARAIIHNFPNEYHHFFGIKYFTWDNIKQTNRNWLLFRDPTVDGLKTGDTDAAGYCLIASANRDGMRLISVVMGSPTEEGRVDDSQHLINYGYRFYSSYKLYDANATVTQARVWGGENDQVALGLTKPLYIVVPKGEYKNLSINIELNNTLHAPITQGATYGTLTISLNNKPLTQQPIVALTSDPRGGIWTRFSDYIALSFHKIFSKKSAA